MVLIPPKLRASDLIGVISPGSPVNPEYLDIGTNRLKDLGFRVVTGKYAADDHGYLAGDDEKRLADLHDMFADPEVKMIMLARGGYGCIRLIESIDYSLIKENPKILTGFSDATALQFAIYNKTGLVTFSGPMVESNFGKMNLDKAAEKHFWDTLTNGKGGSFLPDPVKDKLEVVHHGKAEGVVICGCLSVILGLIGTDYCPDLKDAILVIEDISEPPYKLDRALQTLKIHNVFDKISGLVLGSFVDCSSDNKDDLTIEDVIEPIAQEKDFPVMRNLKYGHTSEIYTIPFGIKARLDTDKKAFELLETPVN
ncbi:MAG: LD-carboxypeptidase [bacterium]|nr:LD-carboxypeptidase [bacterium]